MNHHLECVSALDRLLHDNCYSVLSIDVDTTTATFPCASELSRQVHTMQKLRILTVKSILDRLECVVVAAACDMRQNTTLLYYYRECDTATL